MKKMKTFSLGIAILAVLLLFPTTSLWAGNTRTISVSCVVEPRISAQLGPDQGLTANTQLPALESSSSLAKGKLLEKKEYKKIDLAPYCESAIIYSYCER